MGKPCIKTERIHLSYLSRFWSMACRTAGINQGSRSHLSLQESHAATLFGHLCGQPVLAGEACEHTPPVWFLASKGGGHLLGRWGLPNSYSKMLLEKSYPSLLKQSNWPACDFVTVSLEERDVHFLCWNWFTVVEVSCYLVIWTLPSENSEPG